MKRIGIDIRLLGKKRTGDEAVFFHLTRELLKRDDVHEYVLFTDETDITKLAALQVRLECVGMKNVSVKSLGSANRFLWNAWALPRALRKEQIDVYHTQYIAPFFLPRTLKLATHIHDISFAVHPEWISTIDLFFLKLLIPRSIRRSDLILVPSEFTRNEVETVYAVSPEKIRVIENACGDLWQERATPEERERILQKFGLKQPFFVSLGTMQPRKNLAFLLAVFRNLRLKVPELLLVLVGDPKGHHVDPVIQKVLENGEDGFLFTGYLHETELRALLSAAQGFVFPSLYEGFGIPLLEAFSAEVPVAASDIPPFHEVAAEAALYFPPTSLADAEKALYTLYIEANERERLVLLGKERLKSYSWEKSAVKLLAAYQYLIG